MGGRDLVFDNTQFNNPFRFYVWGRFYAKKSISDSRLYKPVFTIDGQWRQAYQDKEYYMCGFSTKTIETEGNIQMSRYEIKFDNSQGGMSDDEFGLKMSVELEIDCSA